MGVTQAASGRRATASPDTPVLRVVALDDDPRVLAKPFRRGGAERVGKPRDELRARLVVHPEVEQLDLISSGIARPSSSRGLLARTISPRETTPTVRRVARDRCAPSAGCRTRPLHVTRAVAGGVDERPAAVGRAADLEPRPAARSHRRRDRHQHLSHCAVDTPRRGPEPGTADDEPELDTRAPCPARSRTTGVVRQRHAVVREQVRACNSRSPRRTRHLGGRRTHARSAQPMLGEPCGESRRRRDRVFPRLDVERVHEPANQLDSTVPSSILPAKLVQRLRN